MPRRLEMALNVRTRKLIGIPALLAVVLAWALGAVMLYEAVLTSVHFVLQMLFFVVAGMGWFFPAALLVAWMQKPDSR